MTNDEKAKNTPVARKQPDVETWENEGGEVPAVPAKMTGGVSGTAAGTGKVRKTKGRGVPRNVRA